MDTPTADRRPKSGHQKTAVPIARRLVHSTRFFPLWWRGSREDERMQWSPGATLLEGFKSIVSLFVGEQSDRRIVQALAARRHESYDYTFHYTEGRRGPVVFHDSVDDFD